MKSLLKLFTVCVISITLSFAHAAGEEKYQLIPAPTHQKQTGGFVSIKNGIEIISDNKQLDYIQNIISVGFSKFASAHTENAVNVYFLLDKDYRGKDESYKLKIEKKGISIQANSKQGILYGAVSLLQLVNAGQQIPMGEITDNPRFAYRGFMLDESRHFFGPEKIKQLLDMMMYLKLNTFSWHLTDEPGWRLEIKSYPKLTSIGARGNYTAPEAPARFYTQSEIKEIVAYARERGITVIPEIDMPGHATAANKAYPEFSGGGSKKHPEFTFNPGKEETYTYLTNILHEVTELFPSSVIHFGGDEVHYGNEEWKNRVDVQRLMKNSDLTNLKEVESYFSRRMADSIQALSKIVGAWDEAVDCDLNPSNTLIYWWRHDKPEQLKKSLQEGYFTVLCPRQPLYFDFVQDSSDVVGRRWNGFNPYDDVYNFPDSLHVFQNYRGDLIRGIQANLWTETVVTNDRFDYLVYTRLAAMAEAAWTLPHAKDISSFSERLKSLFKYYDSQSIYYYDPFNTHKHKEPRK